MNEVTCSVALATALCRGSSIRRKVATYTSQCQDYRICPYSDLTTPPILPILRPLKSPISHMSFMLFAPPPTKEEE